MIIESQHNGQAVPNKAINKCGTRGVPVVEATERRGARSAARLASRDPFTRAPTRTSRRRDHFVFHF